MRVVGSFQYHHVEPSETLTGPVGHYTRPLAEIRLGQHEGAWLYSLQMDGPTWGCGGPLGWSEDNGAVRIDAYPTRDAALAAAVAQGVRYAEGQRRFGDNPVKHLNWLHSLLPASGDQLDMFGSAA